MDWEVMGWLHVVGFVVVHVTLVALTARTDRDHLRQFFESREATL